MCIVMINYDFGHWFTNFIIQLCDLDNELGDDGATYIADVLTMNTTLKAISLYREAFFCFVLFFFFYLWGFFERLVICFRY